MFNVGTSKASTFLDTTKVLFKVLNTCKYTNIPQNRERIFIVGFKDEFEWNDKKQFSDNSMCSNNFQFPNQVNNSLGFPGLFRGALDVRALKLTDGMCLAAASEIASYAEKTGLSETHIVPTMDALELFAHEAAAVAMQAIEEGVAQIKLDKSEVYENALEVITRSRNITRNQMDSGFIKPAP